ncbi:GGDEF domain-containing protein, partial [Oceanospirillum sp. HFRX-1_2]
TLFVLLTPSSIFTGALYPMLIFMCICIGLATWAMFKLVVRNRSGIRILVIGALALIGGILHDLLIFLEFIEGKNLLGIGVLIFLISQLGFLTFYRTQEQLRILDLNKSLNEATDEIRSRIQWRREELKIKEKELEQRKKEVSGLLRHDELTGLLNRHHFLELIERRQARMPRLSHSLIIIDIDRYKLIVDQHGRAFAESVLVEMADLLKNWCDGYFDRIPARYGGDEFIVWLGRCSLEQAEECAKEIRKKSATIRLPAHSDEPQNALSRFTVSTGVASASADQDISSSLQ